MCVAQPHLIKSEPLGFVIPGMLSKELIIILGSISKACEIFAQGDDEVGTCLLCLANELQLIQTPFPCFVVASDDDLFLLDSKRQVS